jgi:hypothetical protein
MDQIGLIRRLKGRQGKSERDRSRGAAAADARYSDPE